MKWSSDLSQEPADVDPNGDSREIVHKAPITHFFVGDNFHLDLTCVNRHVNLAHKEISALVSTLNTSNLAKLIIITKTGKKYLVGLPTVGLE